MCIAIEVMVLPLPVTVFTCMEYSLPYRLRGTRAAEQIEVSTHLHWYTGRPPCSDGAGMPSPRPGPVARRGERVDRVAALNGARRCCVVLHLVVDLQPVALRVRYDDPTVLLIED